MSRETRTWRLAKASVGLLIVLTLAACKGSSMPGISRTGPRVPVLDNWTMVGHDSHHTSASAASVPGSLKQIWRYNPQAATGDTFCCVYSAVATTTGVFVHWFQSNANILGAGPSVDGISTAGARTWTWVAKRDFDEGHWPSIFNGGVTVADDQDELLDLGSGKLVKTLESGFDTWGETIPDPTGLYGSNVLHADGPDLLVYAVGTTNTVTWKALQQTTARLGSDNAGGMVLANDTLFYAASYSQATPNASGLYALSASTGTKTGYVATTVVSDISADSSNIYLLESPSNLVARSQSTLAKVWSVSVSAFSTAPPLLANTLVIISSFNGIEAHNVSNGSVAWTSTVQAESLGQYSTGMAAALGSNTLVVTGFDGLYVLNLTNGSTIWHGGPSGTANPIIVNDPALGATVYVTDGQGVIALIPD